MNSRTFIGVREVTDMLGYPGNEYFLRRRKRLESEFAFPRPCPWEKKRLLYKASEVTAWIEHAGSSMQELAANVDNPSLQENIIMLAAAKVA